MGVGQFIVPEVSALDPIGEDLTVGFWVGIDGDGDQQVLQAGVRADVSGGFFGGDVSYSAWTEWLDAAHMDESQDRPIIVENFRVAPGESISVLVCAPFPDQGHIVLMNLSWGRPPWSVSPLIPALRCTDRRPNGSSRGSRMRCRTSTNSCSRTASGARRHTSSISRAATRVTLVHPLRRVRSSGSP